jgi:hypothetical protein
MIGTSSTPAGRIWKSSGVFILLLIVHDSGTDATARARAGASFGGVPALPGEAERYRGFSKKKEKSLDNLPLNCLALGLGSQVQ